MHTMHLLMDRLPSPVGPLTMVFDETATLHAVEFDGYEARMHRLLSVHREPCALVPAAAPDAITLPIRAYFDGEIAALERLAVAPAGTAFQREVWTSLRGIPAGTTTTYGRLAARLGRPSAARAVGLANGSNPIVLVLPCHRVIGANGTLTGYGGGLVRKRWLLAHEGVELARMDGPEQQVLAAT